MRRWILLPLVALLAACSAEPAAYLISGSDVSLTIERTKPNFWTDSWDLSLIVRRTTDCQRRYPLKPAGRTVKIEVYSPEAGVYILRQNKRWYVTDLKTCGFSAYKEPPPEPGDLMGAFQEKDGVFAFVDNKDKSAAAAKPGAE